MKGQKGSLGRGNMVVRELKPKALLRVLILLAAPLFVAACNVDLYSKLSETEANEIVALLLRNGVSANRILSKDGLSLIRVDESAFADAMAILNDAGLPRQKFASMGDIFADNKLVSSPTEERARFIYALSQELSKTLSEIDGVLAARVHLVLPSNDPLKEDQKPSSASVFLKHDPAVSLVPLLPQIKTLVTNSIEGLNYDKVSVVFVPGQKRHQIKAASVAGESGFKLAGLVFPPAVLIGVLGVIAVFGFLMPQAGRIYTKKFKSPAEDRLG